jgi:hypothetical protein
MLQIKNLYFHESTIVAFSGKGALVELNLDDVQKDSEKISVRIAFVGVNRISVDGEVVKAIDMVFPDGEVLTLKLADREAELIVEWNDFGSHTSITKAYRIEYEKLECQQTQVRS